MSMPSLPASCSAWAPAAGASEQEAVDIDGKSRSLSEYAGKVTLVVNVASACGYTDENYKGEPWKGGHNRLERVCGDGRRSSLAHGGFGPLQQARGDPSAHTRAHKRRHTPHRIQSPACFLHCAL